MVTECGQQLQPTYLPDDDVDANFDNYFCRLWLFSQIMKISSSNPPTSLWWRCGLMCLQKLDLEYCNPSSCNPHTSLMEMWIGDGCKILQLTSLMEMVLNDASMKHCYAPNFYNDYRTCNQVRFPNPLFPGGDPVNCNPPSSLETMIARIGMIYAHNFDNHFRSSTNFKHNMLRWRLWKSKWASSCSPPTSLELMMIVN